MAITGDRIEDRTFDVLVAERFLGYKWVSAPWSSITERFLVPVDTSFDLTGTSWELHDAADTSKPANLSCVLYYATDRDAAWLLIDRMAGLGYWCKLTTPFEPGGHYSCGFTPHSMTGWNGRPDFEGMARTLCMAIVLAVLAYADGKDDGLRLYVDNADAEVVPYRGRDIS